MNRRIKTAQRVLAKAKADLSEVLAEVQSTCPHRNVVETPWVSGNYLAPSNARRICTDCGLEEEGSHWSGGTTWSRFDFEPPQLGNLKGRRLTSAPDREAFYRLRVR